VLRRDPGAQQGLFGSLRVELEQPDVFARWLSFQSSIEGSRTIEPVVPGVGRHGEVGIWWRGRRRT